MILDTHILIWLLTEPEKVGRETLQQLERVDRLSISVVSLYEIAIKERLGKLKVLGRVEQELEIQQIDVIRLMGSQLRRYTTYNEVKHRDPFDLAITALAAEKDQPLVTADRRLLDLGLCKLIDARK